MSPSGGAGHDGGALDVEWEQSGAAGIDATARKRAAVETFARHEANLRRTAQRYSICADDADEALQRGLEILLQKAPTDDPRELIRWTQTVVKHEALAVRAERERILAGPAAAAESEGEDWVAMLPTEADGPAERAERHEAIERSREALATLKPQELRALTLLAEGYSYREISQITGYSATKVNRALAEGRERFRRFLVRRDGGGRCTELAPLLSAFADGEAGEADVTTLREHLRSCPHCRATLRAYRAAPRAAAALAPVLPPLRGSLADRLHDAYAAVATRVGGTGGSDSALGGLAAAGGGRGVGMTALAKVLAICAGTVGGAAACVATGVVPAPLLDPPDHHSRPAAKVSHHPRQLANEGSTGSTPDYELEPTTETEAEAGSEPAPQEQEGPPEEKKKPRHEEATPPPEVASTPPPSESGATEFVEPAPAPEPISSTATAPSSTASPTSSSSSSSGTAAGEFGP